MSQIKIAYKTGALLPLDKLKVLQGELKSLPAENYEKLKREIVDTGFAFPPHVWLDPKSKHWYLVDGTQRVSALLKMREEGFGIGQIPVVVVAAKNIQEAKRRVLQATSQYGHITEQGLVDFMNGAGIDLDFLGEKFDLPNIDMDELSRNFLVHDGKVVSVQEHQRTIGKTDDDAVPENVKSICKLGDLWQLGSHRLLCGDSLNKVQVSRLMDGKLADMVFTDPPYNVAYGSSKNPIWGSKWNGTNEDGVIRNDSMSSDDWVRFCTDVAMRIKEVTAGPIYVCHAPGPDGCRMTLSFVNAGLHWSSTLILYKDRLVPGRSDYQKRYESCFYGWTEGAKIKHISDRTVVDVWEYKRPSVNDIHPTMKPVELIERAVIHHPHVKSVVDLFGGSGSTLIACEKMKRQCYMMELDPHYCDVIIKRWEDFTGQKAEKVSSGKPRSTSSNARCVLRPAAQK